MRGRDIKELIRSPKIYMFVSVYCVCVSECSCLWVSFQYDFPLVVILFRTQTPKPIQSISFTFFSAMMPLMFVNFEKKNNKHWSLLFFSGVVCYVSLPKSEKLFLDTKSLLLSIQRFFTPNSSICICCYCWVFFCTTILELNHHIPMFSCHHCIQLYTLWFTIRIDLNS